MILNWIHACFPFDVLLIGLQGATLYQKTLQKWHNFEQPADLIRFLNDPQMNKHALKVYIDGVEHQFFQKQVVQKFYTPSRHLLKQLIDDQKIQTDEHIFHVFKNKRVLSGFVVRTHSALKNWISSLQKIKYPIVGIYSFIFEISRCLKIPQLLVIPNQFQQLRFIFADPQGLFFYRLLPVNDMLVLDQEIEKTLAYVCREFKLNFHQITVVAQQEYPVLATYVKKWHTINTEERASEAFLLNFIQAHHPKSIISSNSISRLPWYRWIVARLFPWISIVVFSVILIQVFICYQNWTRIQSQNQVLQTKINILKQKISVKNLQQLENKWTQMHAQTLGYRNFLLKHPSLLEILMKLKSELPIVICQISYTLINQHSTDAQTRFLLQCEIKDDNQDPLHINEIFKQYINQLQQQFPNATCDYDFEQTPSERDDVESSKWSRIKTQCFIQINDPIL